MKYFLDTEFIEDGKTIDLISIGIVCEDGREYYAVNSECDLSKANDWVKENVITQLPKRAGLSSYPSSCAWKSKSEIKSDIIQLCTDYEDPDIEFWGYYSDYDWVVFCQLFGTMIDLPKGFPMFCLDLQQEAYKRGVKLDQVVPQSNEHHALADARWNKEAYDYLFN